MPDGSGIFTLRTIAIWYRERKFMAFKIINTVVRPIPGGYSQL
jgi:hypothetical protein